MKHIKFVLLAAFLFIPEITLSATFSDNFDSYADLTAVNSAGWSADGSQVSLVSSGCRSGKCLKLDFSHSGTQQVLTHPLNESEVYIRFYAKRTGFGTTGGNKFLKLHGQRVSDTNYANITFGQSYGGGSNYGHNTGDGSGTANDTTCNWYWYAHSLPCTGTTQTVTSELNMVNGTWYAFEFHIYPNTNGNYNGIIRTWVDGVLRLHYTNLRIRNDSNIRNFGYLSFVDYVGATPDSPYSIWIDDVVVSTTGPIGIAGVPPSGGGGADPPNPATPRIINISP